MNHRTFSAKPVEAQAARVWWVVDAADKPLGRLASQIAAVLRGKTKPTFTPHVDTGDFVVVVNASKVKLTGQKLDQKHYYAARATATSWSENPSSRSKKRSRECCPRTCSVGSS